MISKASHLDFTVAGQYSYFYQRLIDILHQQPALPIRQLLAFSKQDNLQLFHHILPLAFSAQQYKPYYAYTPQPSGPMPYFILTNQHLLLLNHLFTNAICITDPATIQLYQQNFEATLTQADLLLKSSPSPITAIKQSMSIYRQYQDEPLYWIEPQPCIGHHIPHHQWDTLVKPHLPERDMLVVLLKQHFSALGQSANQITSLCSWEGTHALPSHRRIYFTPAEMISPIEASVIHSAYQAVTEEIKNGRQTMYLSKPGHITLPQSTLISISQHIGVFFLMVRGSQFIAFTLAETTITSAFADFAENIQDTGLYHTTTDSLAVLENM